jgi:uncharacterized protein (TIGR02391 family)
MISVFEISNLRAICAVLADTSEGLTGNQIGKLLGECAIDDPFPGVTKRDRLYAALDQKQSRDGCGNNVVAFVQKAMNPVNYIGAHALFEQRRAELNKVLLFSGYQLGEDGRIQKAEAVTTLSEAEMRAGRLRKKLFAREVHSDVIRFCQAELLQDNYFHSVFEAAKSLADKIREKSGLLSDGAQLVDEACGMSTGLPILAFNTLRAPTEQSEHTGLMNLLKGLFGMFRNTTGHAPKIKWAIKEEDALDMLSLTSLLHRRLDAAVRTR